MRDKIVIGNICRPPKDNGKNATIDNFLNKITLVISKMVKINTNVIITGDFIIDLLQMN